MDTIAVKEMRRRFRSGSGATRISGRILWKGPMRAGMLRARKKRGAGNAPRPIAQFSARKLLHPSFPTSKGPPALRQRVEEHSLPPGIAVTEARNLPPKMSIAQSGVAHYWPQQRSSFSTAKCNPDQRDRRAVLHEFPGLSQPPRAQARGETIGHIRFPLTLARKNNRFSQRALSRTTGTL